MEAGSVAGIPLKAQNNHLISMRLDSTPSASYLILRPYINELVRRSVIKPFFLPLVRVVVDCFVPVPFSCWPDDRPGPPLARSLDSGMVHRLGGQESAATASRAEVRSAPAVIPRRRDREAHAAEWMAAE